VPLNSVEACRGGFPCDLRVLKEAAHCGVYHGPEGSLVQRIATAINIKPGTLSDQINPNEPDYPQAKNLEAIAILTDSHPVIAQYFARLQGGFFFRVKAGSDVDKATATSVREFGEFLQVLASGELVTPALLAKVRKEGGEAMASIKAAMELVEARAAAAGIK
jgi:hypothetical protein